VRASAAADEVPRAAVPHRRVLLVTEGTYPFHFGGVSTWCHSLLTTTPEVAFSLLAISHDPSAPLRFTLPPNVTTFVSVPIWGVLDPREDDPAVGAVGTVLERRRAARAPAVAQTLPGLLARFVAQVLTEPTPVDDLGRTILQLHRLLVEIDAGTALRARPVWEATADTLSWALPAAAERVGYAAVAPTVHELRTGYRWLTHWLSPLARPIPTADVVHAAMAGTCSLVAVAAKLDQGRPFLLTEHGVYLREQYIAERRRRDLLPKLLALGYARATTALAYAFADQIAPCCDFNARWELAQGAARDRVRTSYYGVDPTGFPPGEPPTHDPATVAWVGRINPLKDVETLLRAAAVVHAARPDVTVRLYGSAAAADRTYEARCLELRHELGLDDVVQLEGYTDRPVDAFNVADIVVSSSISEGTPFATIEAMLCARPVVATGVGGVPEQLGGAGVVVDPHDAAAMGEAIVRLADDPTERQRLGLAGRARALELFSLDRSHDDHLAMYDALANGRGPLPCTPLALPPPAGLVTPPVALDRLVERVATLVPLPLDRHELRAVLESRGITEAVARRQYHVPDVAGLAAEVLPAVRERVMGRPVRVTPDPPRPDPAATARTVNTVVLSLLGPLVVLALHAAGALDAGATVAVSAGFALAMLTSNAFAFATARRASFYVAIDDAASARAVMRDAALAIGGVALAVAVAAAVALATGASWHDAAVLVAAFAVTTLLWVASAWFAALADPLPFSLAAVVAFAVAVVADRSLASVSSAHAVGAAAAAAGVMALLVLAWVRRSASHSALAGHGGPRLPPGGRRVVEASPYVATGVAVSLLLLVPHLVAWLGAGRTGDRFVALEVGLTAAMLPLLLAVAGVEVMLRDVHRAAWVAECALTDRRRLPEPVVAAHRGVVGTFVAEFVVAAALPGGALVLALMVSGPDGWAATHTAALLGGFTAGLVTYLILGVGELYLLECLSFGQPSHLASAAAAGVVMTLALTAALASWTPAAAFAAAWAGALVFVLLTRLVDRRLLAHVDHAMATSF